MSPNNAAFIDLSAKACRHGTSTEAAALADIAESLAGIDYSLHQIAEALSNAAPWNVSIKP